MLAHELALAQGKTLAELDATMTAAEFAQWVAFHELRPWGAQRDNWHHAQTQALLYNINRGKAQSAVKVSDFMYKDEGTRRRESFEAFRQFLDARAVKND